MSTTQEFKVTVLDDGEALARNAAAAIEELANARIKATGWFNLALSGGSTPKAVYSLLGNPKLHGDFPWAKTRLFWGDERRVKPDHPDSNYKMVYESLLKNGPVPLENIFPISTGEATADESADKYAKTLHDKIATKKDGFPAFDLILLGVGPDGHTASLFPGTPAPKEMVKTMTTCDPLSFNPAVKPAVDRVSITSPVIWRAENVFVLAEGASKKEMLAKIFQSGKIETELVARLLWRCQGKVRFFIDQAAFPKQ
ncbi:MAG: 6-phosphogluconolactonase [Planctomycetota bacterium]